MSKDKFSKSLPKSVQNAQNIKVNKKEFIKGLLKEGSTIIWPKEMKMAKTLLQIFPNEDFWKKVSLKEVISLVAFLTSEAPYIKLKYSEFNFQPELKTEEIKLGDKIGDDYNSAAKPKTIKNFLK